MHIIWNIFYYVTFFVSSQIAIVEPSNEEIYDAEPLTIVGKYDTRTIHRFFNDLYRQQRFNGCVLVAHEGEPFYEYAFGYANFKTKDSLNINDAFQLASVSKPFTATALLMLVQAGKLSLDDSLQKFFPNMPYHGVTVRMLLIHRSGLPNYMYFSDTYWKNWRKPISNNDVINIMESYKPNIYYFPNRRYNYCNTNYSLIASIIEKVSGMTYEQYMKTKIFIPLNMSNTTIFDLTKINNVNYRVKGHDKRNRRESEVYMDGVVGDKGIYTTVKDMLQFDRALYEGVLLNDSMQKQAYTPAHKELRIWDNYGLGWRLDATDSSNVIVYHTGWWRGFKTYFMRFTGKKVTLIVLSNSTRTFLNINKLKELVAETTE
jgi:CubicO group peptidase (beta-lactamase class C family)